MSKNKFRLVVIILLFLNISAVAYEIFLPDPLVEKVYEYSYEIDSRFLLGDPEILLAYAGILLVVALVNVVGLLLFMNWARYLYLIGFALVFPLGPYTGLLVQNDISAMLNNIISIMSGFILALLFFSPVASYFHKGINRVQKNDPG